MGGKHDKGAEEIGLVATGPIVVRGLSRGMRAALSTSRPARHRSADDVALLYEGHAAGVTGGIEAVDGTIDRADGAEEERDMTEPLDQPEPERSASSPSAGSGEPDAGSEAASSKTVAEQVIAEQGDAHPTGPDASTAGTSDENDVEDEEAPPHPHQRTPLGRGAVGAAAEDAERHRQAPGAVGLRGAMRLRARGVNRAVAGVAVLVVLALVCAGLIAAVVVKTRNDAATAAREAAAYTPPALDSPAAAASGPVVPIISDGSATDGAAGLTAQQRWPALLGGSIDGDAVLLAGAGSGYTRGGDERLTFVDQAARIPADADVVVFLGGAADTGSSALALARAATQAFAAARDRAPDAEIVVVGPLFEPSGTTSTDLDDLRTALRSAARIAGARWVDPVGASWLSGVSDASGLTAAKERTVARRLAAEVAAVRR